MIEIAVDAMGSDKSPESEIRGAILACRSFDVRVSLVGPEDVLSRPLEDALHGFAEHLPITVVHASEWISMDDKAAQAVRSKRDSSMRVGLKMVREGRAAGFLTAGNTGAAMATAKMVLGSLSGLDRPALATALPTTTGQPTLLLDVGANVDSDPENLVHFALMGSLSTPSASFESQSPASACFLSARKIPRATRSPATLFRCSAALAERGKLNFIGNVEGRDLYNGAADVIVCDGFVGNVALKTSEGLAKAGQRLPPPVAQVDRYLPSWRAALPQSF